MLSTTLSHHAEIRATRREIRRKSAQDIRTIRRNIRVAAANLGYSLPKVAKDARIPRFRALAILLHIGREMTVAELHAFVTAVQLEVSDVFAGTQEVTA